MVYNHVVDGLFLWMSASQQILMPFRRDEQVNNIVGLYLEWKSSARGSILRIWSETKSSATWCTKPSIVMIREKNKCKCIIGLNALKTTSHSNRVWFWNKLCSSAEIHQMLKQIIFINSCMTWLNYIERYFFATKY